MSNAPAPDPVVRVRPGKQFFITVSLVDPESCVRSDFLSYFDNLVSYCIAVESSKTSNIVSTHLHAFLEFSDRYFLSDIRNYVLLFSDDSRVDVQACRSKKSCLKYISKEDVNLLTNVKSSLLHFNYRIHVWASNVTHFSHTDPFVVEHRFNYNYIRKYFNDFQLNKSVSPCNLYQCYNAFFNWSMECALWWNSVISDFKLKRKCLYLYGDSNVGKSTFIEFLIGKKNLNSVFYPGVGKFFMQGFKSHIHKVILFEEFTYKFYPVNMLKRLCEGRKYSFPVKCDTDLSIVFCGPIIFISNFNEVDDVAFKNRLLFVSAQIPYWSSASGVVPKCEKENSTSTTIVLSSSEEDSLLSLDH